MKPMFQTPIGTDASPQSTGLIRFITAGSVDDGKSTLIGRLLFDSRAILSDQLLALSSARNKRVSEGEIDLSFLTDGLESEREQGITIDVAYRYFSTARKKFIIADCPGHEQYTRNMVTGASTADAAIILIDASQVEGDSLLLQTRRHTALVNLLGIRHLVVAVNKMDLVDFDQQTFDRIVRAHRALLSRLEPQAAYYIPISALRGDNVVTPSDQMAWYRGPTLLSLLESLEQVVHPGSPLRLPIQLVLRWDGHTRSDQRAYAGRLESGRLEVGETVSLFPSGQSAQVSQIVVAGEVRQQAFAGQSVLVSLDRDLDLARGDVLVPSDQAPSPRRQLEADLAWLDVHPLSADRRYLLRQATRETLARVEVIDRLDLEALGRVDAQVLSVNEIGRVSVRLASPILPDEYRLQPSTGAFILIDEASNQTVAAGMIRK